MNLIETTESFYIVNTKVLMDDDKDDLADTI